MTPLDISEALQDDRQLRSLVGLGLKSFEILLNEFISCLKEAQSKNNKRKPKKRRQRKPGGGRKSAMGSPQHQLVFILFYLKNYPTYDVLAFTFNISRACACESVKHLLTVLKNALFHKNPTSRSDRELAGTALIHPPKLTESQNSPMKTRKHAKFPGFCPR